MVARSLCRRFSDFLERPILAGLSERDSRVTILFPFAEPTLTFQSPRRVAFPSNHNPSETIAAPQALTIHRLERSAASRLSEHNPEIAVTPWT